MNNLGPLLPLLDTAGLAVFAVSGVLVAVRQRNDFVGACFFGLVTAVGGGTLRDLLIGAPVFWMTDHTPVLICLAVAVAAWLIPLRWWPERALEWFDAAGLAAYAVYGASKALQFGVAPVSSVAAGVITACVGGVIRDITVGVPSILMRHELYVTAALVAATLYVSLNASGIAPPWPSAVGVAVGFALRGAAIRWKLALPQHRGS
ncbi:trimeric intracellular cation channel family protein [Agrilutibacter solisilvae]|uniref:Trimeric intracellular cation channel family protein n=1 Tax=Agrilutibacter solisilvae TaxID=2763317 RepID=A0A974Y1X8_9GAMM|nr:trimeric intracellular cation channel family protein [Lysobacter solisilvae]QSX79753.1 trimeric intracellular cation channel family protein [Lysobacter solisilvae]